MPQGDQDHSRRAAPRTARVFIVLPTWNAGPYLDAQLDSLAEQTWADWTLLVRDDGSRDATVATLRRRAAADDRMVLLASDALRLGPSRAFGLLLKEAFQRGADYVACCDQDDVWHPEKLAQQVAVLRSQERVHPEKPLLSACGADLVDARLQRIAIYQPPAARDEVLSIAGRERALAARLLRNVYPGCTLVANRPLLEAALPIPINAAMHDWWLVLVASACGRILPLTEPLVQYRQHANNTVGAGLSWRRLARVLTHPVAQYHRWSANQQAACLQLVELALRLLVRVEQDPALRHLALPLVDALGSDDPKAVYRFCAQRGGRLSLRDRLALRLMTRRTLPDVREVLRAAALPFAASAASVELDPGDPTPPVIIPLVRHREAG